MWREDLGFFHDGVVAAPGGGDLSASRFPASMVSARFTEAAQQVPDDIRAFVLVKIADYSQSPPARRTARSRFRREEWQRRAKP